MHWRRGRRVRSRSTASSCCLGGLEIGTHRDVGGEKSPPHFHPTQPSPQSHHLPACQHAACPGHGCACIPSACARCSPASEHTLRHPPREPSICPGYVLAQSRFGVTRASPAMFRLSPRCSHIAGPLIPLLSLFSTLGLLPVLPPSLVQLFTKQPGSRLRVLCMGRWVNHHTNAAAP